MKVKLLKNFTSCKMRLKEDEIIEGHKVEQMNRRYGLQLLSNKGIIEIIEDKIEETIDNSHDFNGIIVEEPKKKTKKKGV